MGLTLRLIFALAFALWVLPKIVTLMGGPDGIDPSRLLQKNDEYGQRITDGLNSDSAKLIATLDDLRIYDAGLKRCILNEIKRLYGSKLKHVSELSSLFCDSMGINSLQGIEQIQNLKALSLRNNNITSISDLLSLSKLESLDLSGNPEIDDFTSLTRLDKLKRVSTPDLSSIYCYKVEEVFEHLNNNQSSYGNSAQAMIRNVQCRGQSTLRTDSLRKKKDRGGRLSIDERRLLSDYETNQRRR